MERARYQVGPARSALSLLAVVGVVACGPALDDEDDWRSNEPDSTRRMASACSRGDEVPPARDFPRTIEGYAAYDGQNTCSPTEKPGVVAFKNLVLSTYPCTRSCGIVRGCSVGGQSEHKEGRAWDWCLRYPHPAADALLHWLLATDEHGHKHAMARRVGLMYMIWNRKVWKSYEARRGWQHYAGSNPHTDHVHFSFSWSGARKRTSYWKAKESPPPPPPNKLPRGHLVTASCEVVSGWAQDPNAPDKPVTVELYVDEKPSQDEAVAYPVKADRRVDALCDKIGSCDHGFRWSLPEELRDGAPHTIRAYALDRNDETRQQLDGSPMQVTCAAGTPPALAEDDPRDDELPTEEPVDDQPAAGIEQPSDAADEAGGAVAGAGVLGDGCAVAVAAPPTDPAVLLAMVAGLWRRRRRRTTRARRAA